MLVPSFNLSDPVDAAFVSHAKLAAELGLCPWLHTLAPGGSCPECEANVGVHVPLSYSAKAARSTAARERPSA